MGKLSMKLCLKSLRSDAGRLRVLVEYIGKVDLDSIHMGSLLTFIESRRKEGIKTRTINHGLQVVRRILNLAATEWIDEYGLTWLASAPKIKLLPEHDLRKPYPLSWEEQNKLFDELPEHLEKMALFAVNTGCREQEVCQLQWDWEIKIPEMEHLMVFILPPEIVKNGDERLVFCNQTARKRVDLDHVRVHDLKHTFGRRLRSVGVSFEDRQYLLGHRSGRITTHYSSAELRNLWDAANKVCDRQHSGVVLTLLRNPNNRINSNNKQTKNVICL